MGFYQFITNLQKKPRTTRVKILWLTVIISMIFVLGIWMMTVKDYSRKARETSSSVERTIENLKENLPPLRADIKEGVSDLLVPEEKKSSPIKLPLGTND